MKKRPLLAACIFAGLGICLIAAANDKPDGIPIEKVFAWLDKNRDGRLTPDELTDTKKRARLDADKDGFVTLDEARAVIGDIVPHALLGRSQSAPSENEASLKEQPQLLKASEHGVGRLIPDLALHDIANKEVQLGGSTTVLALFSPVCPISRKLGPELARLEKDCAAGGITFLLVNTLPSANADTISKFLTTHELACRVINDTGGALQRALNATTTTEAFLLDAARTLVYRGAVNDQYGLGYAKDAPARAYLRDALTDIAAARPVKYAATTAPGCALDLPTGENTAATASAATITYHNEIARIMQANCVECHHRDGLAPFALETMEDVLDNAGMIKKQIQRGAMPPWFAAAPPQGHDSPWANDRSLSARDKTDLLAWLDGDRATGDPKDAPLPRRFEDEWTIGKPDYIVQLPEPVRIKAEGIMPYKYVIAETTLTEDKWVQGYEIIPTGRSVVHHVIVQAHEPAPAPIHDSDEGYWAAYVPGNASKVYPPGFARKLPAGARVSFQIHYTPNGRATQDQLRMGLIFAKEPPRYAVRTLAMSQTKLDIPPGAAHHIETVSRKLPADVTVMGYVAHMHVRGKSFKYEITLPDGSTDTLLDIPRYDFNWQLRYDCKQARTLPRGSTVTLTAVFDNSASNPANPDPSQRVRWGEQTHDEMMIGYFETFSPLPRGTSASARQEGE